jgi:hypothetical protein
MFAAPLIALAIGAAAVTHAQEVTAPIAEASTAAVAPVAGASIAAIASPAAVTSPSAAPSLAAAEPAPSAAPSHEASAPALATIVVPAAPEAASPPNMVDTPPDANAVPATTTEIPVKAAVQTVNTQEFVAPSPAASSTEPYNPEIARYQEEQSGISNSQQLKSLSEFMSEGEITSPIGLGLKEARRKLVGGQEADGLLVVEVKKGSPAASAGMHAYSRLGKDLVTALALGASMVVPPAILAVPLIDAVPVGESYDMIIGVDGARVSNFLDFQDRMQNLKPGETVYFSVVRDGRRMQVAVAIPKNAALNTF